MAGALPATLGCLLVTSALALGCQRAPVAAFPQTYAGVGVELKDSPGGPTVVQVLPGGPAELAGLKPGQQVVAVDGASVAEAPLASVVTMLRGTPGSAVRVELRQGDRSFTVLLTRGTMARAVADGGYQGALP